MANTSAKKQLKANQQRLKTLAIVIAITNILFALIRGILFYSSFDRFYTVVTIILAIIYVLCYYIIWTAARPTYSETGALIDGGADISKGGILEYVHDLIYMSVLVQFGLIFTKWSLIIFFIIPLYFAYTWFSSGFSLFGSDDPIPENDEMDQLTGLSRKEKRKAERQARKQK